MPPFLEPQTAYRAPICSPVGGEVAAGGAVAEGIGEEAGRLDDFRETDSRLDSEAVVHVQQVLGREVAGRARRVGTSPEAARGSVVGRDPAFQPRVHIGES